MPPKPARIRLALADGSFVDGEFPEQTSLLEVLAHFERAEASSDAPASQRRRFSAYRGVPPVQRIGGESGGKPIAEIHTNLIGDMVPVVELGNHRVSGADLATKTLKDIGATNKLPSKLFLSHAYQRPQLTEEEQRNAVANLRAKLFGALGTPAAEAAAAKGGAKGTAQGKSSPAQAGAAAGSKAGISVAAKKVQPMPEGRATKVMWDAARVAAPAPAAPAPIPAPAPAPAAVAGASNKEGSTTNGDSDDDDDDDDFYELTEEDHALLAESIRARGAADVIKDSDLLTVRFTIPPPPLTTTVAGTEGAVEEGKIEWNGDSDLTVEATFRASETVERLYAHIMSLFAKNTAFDALSSEEKPAEGAEVRQGGVVISEVSVAGENAKETTSEGPKSNGAAAGDDEEEEDGEVKPHHGLIPDAGRAGADLTSNSRLLADYPFYFFKAPPLVRLSTGSLTLLEAGLARQSRLRLAWLQAPRVEGWEKLVGKRR